MEETNVGHSRENTSLTAGVEKRALVWMARRTPSWVSSDHLTLLGLAAMFLAGVSYWVAQWNPYVLFVVVVALALNWLGDSMDGTLARVRDRQRPRYGFYVDHVVDASKPRLKIRTSKNRPKPTNAIRLACTRKVPKRVF